MWVCVNYAIPSPDAYSYTGIFGANDMRIRLGELRAIIREALVNEISRSTPEFASSTKKFDDITPFGHYGVLRPPATDEERAMDAEFTAFAVTKFDEVMETDGFYAKKFLSKGQSGLLQLCADDYIDEAFSGDVIHALLHEATMKGAYRRFKYQGRDPDRPEMNDNLYEILVYWVQSGLDQAKRVGGDDSNITVSIGNRLDPKPKGVMEVVADFFNRYGSQFDESLVLKYFPDMEAELGGNEPAALPVNVQDGFLDAMKNVVGRRGHEGKGEEKITPMAFVNAVVKRFVKTMAGDPELGKLARKDYVSEDLAGKLMSWYNVLRLKSMTLSKRYGIDLMSVRKKFGKKEEA
jgi:hypothetical protein